MVTIRSSGNLGRRVRRSEQTTPPSRKPSTKELMINVGEQLFGRYGVDAVSLREIAVAVGQTNSNAVQYHFKDKRGLVLAIMNDRLRRHEAQRREQLVTLQNSESQTARELILILWNSVLSIRGAEGQYPFCRFLLQYLLQPQGPDHPARELAAYRRSKKVPVEFASLMTWNRLLRLCYPDLPAAQFDYRLKAVAIMFLASVIEHDNAQLATKRRIYADFDIEPIMNLTIAALDAPVSKQAAATTRKPSRHAPT
jgi:AcrR family transcriptional regulator